MLLFSLVLAFCFFGSKGADVDPTTVCYPATLFAEYFNFITDDTGNVTFDFNQELMVQFSHKTGLRIVHDSKNLRTHSILTQGNTTTCRTSIIHPSAVVNQCLPAYAKRLTAANGHLGWNSIIVSSTYSGYSILADTWEVVTEYDTVFRYTFRLLKTYYPVFTQELGYGGTKNMYMYLNPRAGLTVSDKKVFELPGECETDEEIAFPPAVVG